MIRLQSGRPLGPTGAGQKRLSNAVACFNQFGAPSKELSKQLVGYGSRATKKKLFDAQNGKCAWCERLADFSSGPVDHYRPKNGAWRNLPGSARVNDPACYWWLTWEWSNLVFACPRCNDQGHKGNYFPLVGRARPTPPMKGAASLSTLTASTVAGESPCLLDPYGQDDPMDHIEWLPGNTGFAMRDWTWTPIGRTQRGTDTIAILRLDELSERAQSHVRTVLLPSAEEILEHLSSGRIADALSRWKKLSNTVIDDPMAEWRSLSWCALHELIPAARRIAAGLAMPRRP